MMYKRGEKGQELSDSAIKIKLYMYCYIPYCSCTVKAIMTS